MPILVIAAEPAAAAVAAALRLELNAHVETAANRRAGQAALRGREFNFVILDQSLALCSAGRIVRHMRAAISRRAVDRAHDRAAAAAALNGELNATLAGLLLQSELVLREAPPNLVPKVQQLVELAANLRDLLKA
jgi:CheY-like chemotaxis protein